VEIEGSKDGIRPEFLFSQGWPSAVLVFVWRIPVERKVETMTLQS